MLNDRIGHGCGGGHGAARSCRWQVVAPSARIDRLFELMLNAPPTDGERDAFSRSSGRSRIASPRQAAGRCDLAPGRWRARHCLPPADFKYWINRHALPSIHSYDRPGATCCAPVPAGLVSSCWRRWPARSRHCRGQSGANRRHSRARCRIFRRAPSESSFCSCGAGRATSICSTPSRG